MNNKPVKPLHHGIIDYLFAGIQFTGPILLGLTTPVKKAYALVAAGFAAVNALTDTPVGLKPVLSLRDHQRADAATLAGLAALSCAPFIRKHKRARVFHFAFLATAIAHYILTDYGANDGKDEDPRDR